MNWHKLSQHNYYTEPVEFVHAVGLVEQNEYNRLYENQNNLAHGVWQEFDEKYKTGFELKEDITQIDFDREVIALWFFRERSDTTPSPDINIGGRLFTYNDNTHILTMCKDIEIKEKKKKYLRRPFIQLDMSKQKFDKICQRFRKN